MEQMFIPCSKCNWFVFKIATEFVYCAVRTEYLSKMQGDKTLFNSLYLAPWLRALVASLSLWSLGFYPLPVHVSLLFGKSCNGNGFSTVALFTLSFSFHQCLPPYYCRY